MVPKLLNGPNGVGGRKRPAADHWISKQRVQFKQHQFAKDYVSVFPMFLQ
jgi:hypothetical protein